MQDRKNTRTTGTAYERAAGCYLEQLGYEIVQYNFRCRGGEIDIVARDGQTLVFCEVKYRFNGRKGNPLEAVDERKQRRLFLSAMYYTARHGEQDSPCRFDVIGIEGTKIVHIKDAFTG